MNKRISAKTSKKSVAEPKEQNFNYDNRKFVFYNGDTYDGGYKFHYEQILLVKEGKGVYTTDNFDIYNGEWNDDTFADNDIHIRYNNDAQYRGRVDSNGTMSGPGTYIFPDGSSIEAVWSDNKPSTNIIYKEPLGFAWRVENVSENAISFSRGNHFWSDILSNQDVTHSTESLNQREPNQDNEMKEDV